MENLSRSQRQLLVLAGIVAAVLFLALTVYYGVAATGHPRAKHMVLFIVLAACSALVAWFAAPGGMAQGQRRR
ncbi:MAG: hypothetical protein ACR2PL_07765 [Dehalococcoidia bacterium]